MDRYCVWRIASRAWSGNGMGESECRSLVQKGGIRREDLPEVDRVIFRDVCASFAVEAFLMFPMVGGWPGGSDGGYDEAYIRRRMDRWYATPYWRYFLNPVRWFGYPLALLMVLRHRSMLRRVAREAEDGM